MKFSSKRAQERYSEMRSLAMEHNMLSNFDEIFARLLSWDRFDDCGYELINEVHIGCDFEEHSFTFCEHRKDGSYGINGGIIFHGFPGDGYRTNGSVELCPSYGWQMHT